MRSKLNFVISRLEAKSQAEEHKRLKANTLEKSGAGTQNPNLGMWSLLVASGDKKKKKNKASERSRVELGS